MFRSVITYFTSIWCTLERGQERKKFVMLAAIFSLVIGVYWLLRPVKDGVFLTMVGRDYLGAVKLLSILVIIPVVMIYTKMVDIFSRHRVLYVVSCTYAVLAVVFALGIMHPMWGIANTVPDKGRLLGWGFYLFVETIGTVLVALFWAFVADITTPESAKRGYPLIVMGAQMGGVVGPFAARHIITSFGSGFAVTLGAFVFVMIPLGIYLFMHRISAQYMQGFQAEDKPSLEGPVPKPTFYEGIQLIFARPYLLCIFLVVTIYEVLSTLFEFQFKGYASLLYTGNDLVLYFTSYAIWINAVALLCVVFGAGKLSNKMGLAKTLLCMPVVVGIASLFVSISSGADMLFWIMVCLKAVNYSLNQPAKEQLYIPTSKDSKYKAKSWIDSFGSRVSKGLGGAIYNGRALMGPQLFIVFSLILSCGLVGIWICAALFLGKTHAQAIKENRIVC